MALDMLRMEDIINYGSKCLPYPVSYTHLDVYKRQGTCLPEPLCLW